MRKLGVYRGAAFAAPVLVACTAASAVPIFNNAVANQTDVTGGLTALSLTGIITGLTTSNSLVSAFSTGGFSGTLTTSVFANLGAPGSGVNTVAIVYQFAATGMPTPVDQFEFGLDTGADIDFGVLLAATQGSIGDLTTAGQTAPLVDLVDNSALPGNDTQTFDFLAAGDPLGGTFSEQTFGWYILTDGNVALNRVRVEARDSGGAIFDTISLVKGTGQPNLNVPAPGPLALLFGAGGLVAARRRRR